MFAYRAVLSKLGDELGITALRNAQRDVHILMITRIIRMFAYGSSTLILALYLAALGHSDAKIGLFMTLTLIGDVLISLLLTVVADRLGRRRILVLGAVLMICSGVVFATTGNYWILLLAAIVGVISPTGNEIGPFRAVEESTIAHLTDAKVRSDLFALYVVAGTLGTAFGSLLAGWLVQGLQQSGWSTIASFRLVFWLYAVAGLCKASLSLRLSSKCELDPPEPRPEDGEQSGHMLAHAGDAEQESETELQPTKPVPAKKSSFMRLSEKSKQTLIKLCMLFSVDSLASGMVPASLIAFYISEKFGITQGTLGTIIAGAQLVSSFGNILASSIAKRIGLVSTMVFTHLPSALLLAAIPAPTSLALTIVILVARSSLSSMDQAPRSAFLAAVVLPEERTSVMGLVNTVKTMSQSAGPTITGVLAGEDHFWVAFVVAGTLKASYDLAMLKMFSRRSVEVESS